MRLAKEGGTVEKVTANEIVVRNAKGQKTTYKLLKYKRPTRAHVLTRDQ